VRVCCQHIYFKFYRMAQNKEWGPLFWAVLHTAAEQLGKPRAPINQTDEVNTWMLLLKSVEGAMPCQMCREHYHNWISKHPIAVFTPLRGMALRETARKWLYDLHEEVNLRREVTSGITIEQLPILYGSLNGFQGKVEALVGALKVGVQYGRVKMEATYTFRKHLHYFRKITDSI
jgi:hypothetical protein